MRANRRSALDSARSRLAAPRQDIACDNAGRDERELEGEHAQQPGDRRLAERPCHDIRRQKG